MDVWGWWRSTSSLAMKARAKHFGPQLLKYINASLSRNLYAYSMAVCYCFYVFYEILYAPAHIKGTNCCNRIGLPWLRWSCHLPLVVFAVRNCFLADRSGVGRNAVLLICFLAMKNRYTVPNVTLHQNQVSHKTCLQKNPYDISLNR